MTLLVLCARRLFIAYDSLLSAPISVGFFFHLARHLRCSSCGQDIKTLWSLVAAY